MLSTDPLPAFSRIRPEHVTPAIERLLAEARRRIAKLLKVERPHTWESIAQPMEDIGDELDRAWSPVEHLHAVADNPQLRQAFNDMLPKLSAYATELGQNERLYRAYASIAEAGGFSALSEAQRKSIANALRDFRLAGVDLPKRKKARYKAISARLAELSNTFGENVLDATQGWNKQIAEPADLKGLPESARELARETAEREGLEGWLFTLEAPSYHPLMTYAERRELRREVYEASSTRASDRGPNAGKWDNSIVMQEILELRHEQARLLGFHDYAEYSLATKMARSPAEVLSFLADLARRTRPVAMRELEELRRFAGERFGVSELEAWDIPYYSEKLRQHRFSLSQEELRPYFPAPRVLEGMFRIVERLYGLSISPTEGVETWHGQVQFFTIRDQHGEPRGQFFLDLYSRPHKRGGAWMDECVARKRSEAGVRIPVAYLTCNVTPPVGESPALLTHDEVTTLFHEFGHGLHHMLTLVDHPSVAGINGVEWDAVELPSQLMENWCWEREALALISGHYRSREPLPDALYEKLRAAKNFQSGLKMTRQLEFATFDFRLHLEFDPAEESYVQSKLQEVRNEVAVLVPPEFNRFAHSFSHIFGGGYAAGYYSYLWAEVLSSDAFAKFEEEGVFSRDTGSRFLHTVLEKGGSREAMDLFVEFRGRRPDIAALLRHSGIVDCEAGETIGCD